MLPVARDSTTILPPCWTSRQAVARPVARSSIVAGIPGPPIPTTTNSARESASSFQWRSRLAIPRSRTEFSRPATTSTSPAEPGTTPT